MRKRLGVFMLVAALSCASFAGCGSKNTETTSEAASETTVADVAVADGETTTAVVEEVTTGTITLGGNGDGEATMIGTFDYSAAEGAATEDQIKNFNEAYEALDGVDVTPIALLATQVVAGTNYQFLCTKTVTSANAATSLIVVTVYVDLSGKASVINEADFDATKLLEENATVTVEEGITGGWETVGDVNYSLPIIASSAFDKAKGEMVGSAIEPIAYLGSQIVSGTNYLMVCKSTPTTPDAASTLKLVVVYEDLDGNASFLQITDIDPAAFNS